MVYNKKGLVLAGLDSLEYQFTLMLCLFCLVDLMSMGEDRRKIIVVDLPQVLRALYNIFFKSS